MSQYSDAVLADSPIAYYRLNEASGAAAADASGNGRTATLGGSPAYSQAALVPSAAAGDTAIKVTTTAALLTLPNTVSIPSSAGGATLEWWANIPAAAALTVIAYQLGGNVAGQYFIAYLPYSGNLLYFYGGGGQQGIAGVAIPAPDERGAAHHYALVFENLAGVGHAKFYIDGVLRLTGTGSQTVLTAALTGGFVGAGLANVAFDEVAIYDKPLSAAQLAAHYHAGAYLNASATLAATSGVTAAARASYKAVAQLAAHSAITAGYRAAYRATAQLAAHSAIAVVAEVPAAAVWLDIYRSPAGAGDWLRLAHLASPGPGVPLTYADYTAASGQAYEYRVEAVAASGGVAAVTLSQTLTLQRAWLHELADPAATARGYIATDRSDDWQPEITLAPVAGRAAPIAEYGEHETYKVNATLTLIAGSGDRQALAALARARTLVCYRDGDGRRVFGVVPELGFHDDFGADTAAITVEETDYSEGV